MSPLPVDMRDRWASRAEPVEGKGTVCWHVLMSRYAGARAAARAAQQVLRDFSGLHLTPDEWFHMTILVAGSTDDIEREQLDDILRSAQTALRDVEPLDVTLGKVLYHPEAVMLAVEPAERLRAIQTLIRAATASAIGISYEPPAREWTPHVTVAYSTASQPADPIITALGATVPVSRAVIDTVSLIVQWGPERLWDWEQVGAVQLGDLHR
jgi:2'-5' RNA ligase